MRKFFMTISILTIGTSAVSVAKQDSVITQAQLNKIAKNAKTPAIQLAYLANGKVTSINYGEKDFGKGDMVDDNTIFQAASLSKVVATYVFLMLVDKGILDLDKPLWEYDQYDRIKEDPHKELLTGRMVLTHTTGLVNWEANADTKKWSITPLKTRFKPGTDYKYSGEAFYYLQRVAEKLTGKTLNELSSEFIFKPFGMKKSKFSYSDEFAKNIAIGHKAGDSSINKIGKLSNANAAYTLYTTANEYMRFVMEGVINGKGLSKAMHSQFLTPVRSTAEKSKTKERDKYVQVCLGIRTQDNENGRAYWHTGSNGGGFKCVFIVYPKENKALTLFTNSTSGNKVMLPVFQQVFGSNQTFWSLKQ